MATLAQETHTKIETCIKNMEIRWLDLYRSWVSGNAGLVTDPGSTPAESKYKNICLVINFYVYNFFSIQSTFVIMSIIIVHIWKKYIKPIVKLARKEKYSKIFLILLFRLKPRFLFSYGLYTVHLLLSSVTILQSSFFRSGKQPVVKFLIKCGVVASSLLFLTLKLLVSLPRSWNVHAFYETMRLFFIGDLLGRNGSVGFNVNEHEPKNWRQK